MAWTEVLSQYSPREKKTNTKEGQRKTVDALAEIKTGHLPNIGQQCCLYHARSLFSVNVDKFYARAAASSRCAKAPRHKSNLVMIFKHS